MNNPTTAARIGNTDWNLTNISHTPTGQDCDHCGRHLKNLYTVTHTTTGQHMTIGRGCCKKVTGWTLTASEAAHLLRTARETARHAATWADFTHTHPNTARQIDADIHAWRPNRPGLANLPQHAKRDIMRGATPRHGWATRAAGYLAERRAFVANRCLPA